MTPQHVVLDTVPVLHKSVMKSDVLPLAVLSKLSETTSKVSAYIMVHVSDLSRLMTDKYRDELMSFRLTNGESDSAITDTYIRNVGRDEHGIRILVLLTGDISHLRPATPATDADVPQRREVVNPKHVFLRILAAEGLSDWRVFVHCAGNICWDARKMIDLTTRSFMDGPGMFLHELAHALRHIEDNDVEADAHDGRFGDIFSRLVSQYCVWNISELDTVEGDE